MLRLFLSPKSNPTAIALKSPLFTRTSSPYRHTSNPLSYLEKSVAGDDFFKMAAYHQEPLSPTNSIRIDGMFPEGDPFTHPLRPYNPAAIQNPELSISKADNFPNVIQMPFEIDLSYEEPGEPFVLNKGNGIKMEFDRKPRTNMVYGFTSSQVPLKEASGALSNDELDFLQRMLKDCREGYQQMICAVEKGEGLSQEHATQIETLIQEMGLAIHQHRVAVQKQDGSAIEDLIGLMKISNDQEAEQEMENLFQSLKL